MEEAAVSTKYRVVIPKKARENPGIEPGQKVQVMTFPPGKAYSFISGSPC